MAAKITGLEKLNRFRKQVGVANRKAIKAIQQQGKKEHQLIWTRFEAQRTTSTDGRTGMLGVITPRWRALKIRKGLDARRGHAGLGLSRAIKKPASFQKLKNGFKIDITKGARIVSTRTGKALRRVKGGRKTPRRVPVIRYLKHYKRAKAPRLGELSRSQLKRVNKVGVDALTKSIRRVATLNMSKGRFQLNVKVNSLGLKDIA